MSQFCNKCGAPLNGAKFCTKCGAPAGPNTDMDASGAAGTPETPMASTLKTSNEGIKFFGILAIVVVAIIVILVIIFGGRGYKKTVDKYVNSIMDNKPKKLMSLLPDDMVDYVSEKIYDGDKDEMIESLESPFESVFDMVGDSNLNNVKYEIVYEMDYPDNEIEALVDKFKDQDVDLNIKDAKDIKIELKYEADGEEENETIPLTLVKIGRSWYVMPL